jgi:hypothetical protein
MTLGLIANMKTYYTLGMKTTVRPYKGFEIHSFNNRQLGDSCCRGTSFSVYSLGEHISAAESLDTLTEAKSWADNFSNKKH